MSERSFSSSNGSIFFFIATLNQIRFFFFVLRSRIACHKFDYYDNHNKSWLSPFLSTKNVRNNDTFCYVSAQNVLFHDICDCIFFFWCCLLNISCYFIWNSKVVSNSGAYLGIVHVLSCAAQYKRRGPAHSLLSLISIHSVISYRHTLSTLSHYFTLPISLAVFLTFLCTCVLFIYFFLLFPSVFFLSLNTHTLARIRNTYTQLI